MVTVGKPSSATPSGDALAGWRRWTWYWGPALAWAMLLYAVSAQSALPRPGRRLGLSDDLVNYTTHALSYGLLAWLVWRPLHAGVGRLPDVAGTFSGLAAWLFAVMYALFDEVHQAFVPGRTASGWDVLADALGAAVTLAIIGWWHGREGDISAGRG